MEPLWVFMLSLVRVSVEKEPPSPYCLLLPTCARLAGLNAVLLSLTDTQRGLVIKLLYEFQKGTPSQILEIQK